MERNLVLKLGAIGLLIGLLLIGLSCIRSIITERQARRDQVVQDIARSSSLAQQLMGPIVVVPYERTLRESKDDAATGRHYTEERQITGQLYFLPETFKLQGEMRTERRARGIYEARLFHADLRIGSRFELPPNYGVESDLHSYRFGQPSIALGISDIRGIENTSTVLVNGSPLKLLPGGASTLVGTGVHAPIPALPDGTTPARLEISLALALQGTSEFHVIPVGRETQVTLHSNWPHPSFTGEYLPTQHKIATDGFTAQWATSFFSTNLEEALQKCSVVGGTCGEFNGRLLGVSFVDPVDQYLKSDRAIKYALLFISLTFAAFFLFEVMRKLAVHPVQYGLVGAALALFYLLLLSLSEHIGFVLAYLLSAGSCVALLGFYISAVLRSAGRGSGFALALATLYGLLYGLLSADDYALLMGSLLLFGLLAAVMVLTRNVNWFGLGAREDI